MIAIAHLSAITCYMGAAALAATPVARPVRAPVRSVVVLLALGVVAHAVALVVFARGEDAITLSGLGPALSFAGLLLAATLLVVELLAREVSLTLVAAPLAALPTTIANVIGLDAATTHDGARGAWLVAHIALSFAGMAAFATAAAAGTMYLIQRRELRSRRFVAVLRLFPPLATLDRVNHVSSIAAWLGLTLGVVLAVTYSLAYREQNLPQLLWGTGAWVAVGALAVGRVWRGWQARRAALIASVGFAGVVALYVVLRVIVPGAGQFL